MALQDLRLILNPNRAFGDAEHYEVFRAWCRGWASKPKFVADLEPYGNRQVLFSFRKDSPEIDEFYDIMQDEFGWTLVDFTSTSTSHHTPHFILRFSRPQLPDNPADLIR